MICDLYAALEQLYNNGLYSCVIELYPFIGAAQALSAAEAANCALYQVRYRYHIVGLHHGSPCTET
jgi:hypothetical protein